MRAWSQACLLSLLTAAYRYNSVIDFLHFYRKHRDTGVLFICGKSVKSARKVPPLYTRPRPIDAGYLSRAEWRFSPRGDVGGGGCGERLGDFIGGVNASPARILIKSNSRLRKLATGSTVK